MALSFKRILCPVDLSSFSLRALETAASLAEISKATLYLLHVIDNPYDELYMTSITQADPALVEMYKGEPTKRAQVLNATIRHSRIMVQQFAHHAVAAVPRIRYLIETGHPFDRIMDVVEARKIDLIVMATHGRTGLKRMLIGNVAERVVRHAACPVLTFKGRARKKGANKNTSRK